VERRMQWRFWRRGGRKKDADESALEQSRAEANAALAWPASAGAKEILGLQQLVGNQAVLRMLARNSNGTNAKSQGS
jgi:hypothetical protein